MYFFYIFLLQNPPTLWRFKFRVFWRREADALQYVGPVLARRDLDLDPDSHLSGDRRHHGETLHESTAVEEIGARPNDVVSGQGRKGQECEAKDFSHERNLPRAGRGLPPHLPH